ncbi:MAG: glutamate racemase [Chloroflexi bacterium]|nr:glutamate racemase [Chloroflexota bacterium]
MQPILNKAPIGLFDSGVGGLSVLRAIRPTLPYENILYFGDQAHVPYGRRAKQELIQFSTAIVNYLIKHGAKLIVIACNTASAAALHALREQYPEFPIVGMEPAVKPAVQKSESDIVGVLATPSTFESDLFSSIVERFAQDTTLLTSTCIGLVPEIEAGRANGLEARRILTEALVPMLEQGLDSLVLGCTHYAFAEKTITEIVGPDVAIIDPAPAIAQRIESLLTAGELLNPDRLPGQIRYMTSGDPGEMQTRVRELIGGEADVEGIRWQGLELGPEG